MASKRKGLLLNAAESHTYPRDDCLTYTIIGIVSDIKHDPYSYDGDWVEL